MTNNKNMKFKKYIASSLLAGSLIVSPFIHGNANAGYKKGDYSKTLYGETVKLGEGGVKTFGNFKNGELTKVGVLISEDALNGLPQNCGVDAPTAGAKWLICQSKPGETTGKMNDTMVITLDMPKKVAKQINIKKLDLSWLPYGHAPKGVWDKPQFDIHFPFANPTGGKDSKKFYSPKTSQDQLPEGYIVLPGSGFDWDTEALQSHSHAASPGDSPEFKGGEFKGNFLYLSYDGKAIGYEAYVSEEILKSKDYYIQNLKSPKVSYGSDKAPSKLVISYLPGEEAYEVSLENYINVEKK
tara:strand:+ start:6200 stop:7093 length:894 start_codon:yes stop_codon:yes gene_type:complete